MKKVYRNGLLLVLFVLMTVCLMLYLAHPITGTASQPELSSFSMYNGAYIRTETPIGIRFEAGISEEDKNKLTENAEFGMLIIPSRILENNEAAKLEAGNEYALNIPTQKWLTQSPSKVGEGFAGYYSVLSGEGLTDLGEDNYLEFFSARGYVKDEGGIYYTTNIVERNLMGLAEAAQKGGNTSALISDILDADLNSYANLIFDKQNGEETVTQERYVGSIITEEDKIADPSKDNFIFKGWYTNPECTDGNEYTFDGVLKTTLTLYAKWEGVKTFTVQETADMIVGETDMIDASLKVGDNIEEDKQITWEIVTGEDVIELDAATGFVTALKAGTATVKATCENGDTPLTDTCEITVRGNIAFGTHENYDGTTEGVLATIPKGGALRIENIYLPGSYYANIPLFNMIKIPALVPDDFTVQPSALDVNDEYYRIRELTTIYVTISDTEDESKYITYSITVSQGNGWPASGAGGDIDLSYVSARSSASPVSFEVGSENGFSAKAPLLNYSFFGKFHNNSGALINPGIGFGYSTNEAGKNSLYVVGTNSLAVYICDTGSIGWDISSGFFGFSGNRVNVSIRGDNYCDAVDEFTLMFTKFADYDAYLGTYNTVPATQEDVAKFSLHPISNADATGVLEGDDYLKYMGIKD